MTNKDKVKVVFIADSGPREGGNFKAGKTYSMSELSAARWIKRGKAINEDDAKAQAKTKAKNKDSENE